MHPFIMFPNPYFHIVCNTRIIKSIRTADDVYEVLMISAHEVVGKGPFDKLRVTVYFIETELS